MIGFLAQVRLQFKVQEQGAKEEVTAKLPVQQHGVLAEPTEPGSRGALPIPPNPLIGRDAELVALRELLLDAHVRLLTITGPPGTGKTRVAIALAESVGGTFTDGVCYVDLAPLSGAPVRVHFEIPLSAERIDR